MIGRKATVNSVIAALCSGIIALGVFTSGVLAASSTPPQSTHRQQVPDWNQQDTAAYVVSTLNLLHTRTGRPLVTTLTRSANVDRFEVWEVLGGPRGLYIIQLKDAYGEWLGAFVYRMGWMKPMSASPLTDHLGVRHAWPRILNLSRQYPKKLIGTFGSTLPT
jgi:hypothetical protein